MASSINASTSGAGGVITTADNTGILNIQTAGTTAVTVSASQNTTFAGTVTLPTGTLYPIVSGTAVASTSGTSIDFTGIPSWVKRVTVTVAGVSTNGGGDWGIKLGTSAGIVSTGYAGGVHNTGGGVQNPTTYAQTVYANTAAVVVSGTIVIALANSSTNLWTISNSFGASGYSYGSFGGFFIALAGALTTVRITTGNGTDTFDAGSINILYE
jgi:hypothetical protein